MKTDECEMCLGTGYYGDNGPGKKGNNEWQPCECMEQEDGKILRSLGLRSKTEGNLVIINRECFNGAGEDYEIALDVPVVTTLLRILSRIDKAI